MSEMKCAKCKAICSCEKKVCPNCRTRFATGNKVSNNKTGEVTTYDSFA